MALFDEQQITEVRSELEAVLGPIVANFEITTTPQGGAPESIRQGWIGVVLPIRQGLLEEYGGEQEYPDRLTGEVKQNHEAVPVNGYDAVFALAALNKEPEVKYWFESGLEDMGPFIFRAHEGKLEPLVNVDLPSLTVLDGITGIFLHQVKAATQAYGIGSGSGPVQTNGLDSLDLDNENN